MKETRKKAHLFYYGKCIILFVICFTPELTAEMERESTGKKSLPI